MALVGINCTEIEGGITEPYLEFMKAHMGATNSGFKLLFVGASAEDPSKMYVAAFVESQEKMDAYFGSEEIMKKRAAAGGPQTPKNVTWLNACEAISNFPSAIVPDDAYYVLVKSKLAKPFKVFRDNVTSKTRAIAIEKNFMVVLSGAVVDDDSTAMTLMAFPDKAAFEDFSGEEMMSMRAAMGSIPSETTYTPLTPSLVNYPSALTLNPPKTFLMMATAPFTKPFAFYREASMQAMATKKMSEDLANTLSNASGDSTKWFSETGHSLVYVGVDAADSSMGVFLINYGSKQNYENVDHYSEETVANAKKALGIDLGAAVVFPLANETAVVNWPSIATGEGHFMLGFYTLTVPFTTAMKVIVKKLTGILVKHGVTIAVGGTNAEDDSKLYILWHAPSKEALSAYQSDPARLDAVAACIDMGSIKMTALSSVPPIVGAPSSLYIPPKF